MKGSDWKGRISRLYASPAVANQAVRTLSAMYRSACEWGLAPEGTNPCRAIAEYPWRRREPMAARRRPLWLPSGSSP